MKHSTQDCGLIHDEVGKFVGVNLGWDFTAEHEWGTKEIQAMLGIKGEGYGPERHIVTRFQSFSSKEIKLDRKMWYVIACYRSENADRFLPQWGDGVRAAWAGHAGFVFAVQSKETHDRMLDAITAGDVLVTNACLFASEGNAFSGSGLKIVIRSAMPQKWVEKWADFDKDYEKMLGVAASTGIETKLRAAGKQWFSLRPSWKTIKSTRRGEFKSEHEVMFWLNPMDQQNNEAGWYSVEDLEAWIKNEGPILKSNRNASSASDRS